MLQTLPAVMLALYTRWFHRWGLLAGWAAGMAAGTWIAASQDFTPVWATPVIEATVYTGLVALALNVVVAGVVTLVLGRHGRADELDETREADYDELRETREPAPTVSAGVVLQELLEADDERLHDLVEALRLREPLVHVARALGGVVPHDLDEQTLLRAEVVVQEAARDAGLARHVVERRRRRAARGDAGAHRGDDPLGLVALELARGIRAGRSLHPAVILVGWPVRRNPSAPRSRGLIP